MAKANWPERMSLQEWIDFWMLDSNLEERASLSAEEIRPDVYRALDEIKFMRRQIKTILEVLSISDPDDSVLVSVRLLCEKSLEGWDDVSD